jgi:hypothetical protein
MQKNKKYRILMIYIEHYPYICIVFDIKNIENKRLTLKYTNMEKKLVREEEE